MLFKVPMLRAQVLLANTRNDAAGYRKGVDRYRARAAELGSAPTMR